MGGIIALIQDGDMIEIDIPARVLRVDVSDAELSGVRPPGSRRSST